MNEVPLQQPAATPNAHFHTVRFYEDDRSLYRMVVGFIVEGLVAGQPAVVIATPVHREGIAGALQALSFDPTRLRANRKLLMLDAEETLSMFMRNGVPDWEMFRRSIGDLVEGAAGGRPETTVRAYGEMVDCLWKSGAADAAIRLEVLWNQLARTCAFSLLCVYSIGNFYKHGAYEQICAQHTHIMSEAGQPTRVAWREGGTPEAHPAPGGAGGL
jgi:hypothetical protein